MRSRFLAPLAALAMLTPAASAQRVRIPEQTYLPASHNWVFRRNYPGADRLFNAFDYGHAVLYEELLRHPDAPPANLEEREFAFITRRLLAYPPRMPLEESAVEVDYARLAPEAKAMFEWAHLLHRQIYDVLADERLTQAQKDGEVAALVAYYRTRPDLAFSDVPKSMELMEGQPYSTVFRERYPKFNGLIWAYHWMQVGLYEPLLAGATAEERQTGVAATVARFRQMLESAPERMPRIMPMTAAVAPRFAERYPDAAIIFDNLHSMHDVISDILASPEVPRARKRAEILRAAARYRDSTSFAMTREEWVAMARGMGVANMGGPATGFLAAFPEPTLPRGAAMAHGGHADARPAADPLAELRAALLAEPLVQARLQGDPALARLAAAGDAGTAELITRLMADAEVLARVHADPRLHRLWSASGVQDRLRAPAHQHH